jgi:tetratricopeptide (TPR) repeat protein
MQNILDCRYLRVARAFSMLLALLSSVILSETVAMPSALGQTKPAIARPSSKQLSDALDDYIYFAGVDDMQKSEIIASAQQLVSWTEADKLAVRQAISDAFRKTPWLIAGSGFKHKLAFCRISQARSVQKFRGAPPYAFSGPGYIVFTDTFFGAKNQAHALVHELVHVADCGNTIAYSPEWVKFAQPTICKLRLREQLLTQKGWFWYNDEVRKKNIWPGLYGSENLKEALAEYFTAYAENNGFPIAQDFKDDVATLLIAPSDQQLVWRDTMTQALIQFKCRHYDDAITLLIEAQKLDPAPPALDYYLAECFMHRSDGAALALPSISKALAKFDQLVVAIDEPMVHVALLMKSNLLRNNGHYDEAILLTNKILSFNLYDEDARFIRGACENRDGLRGQSLQDTYFSRGCFGFVFTSLMGIACDPIVARLAVDQIVKIDKSGEGLWGRAQFFEQCAHTSEGPADRDNFNRLALADYQANIEKDDGHKADGLLRCADLYLKLGDAGAAQHCCDEVVQIHTEGLAPRIMQLKIWEAAHDKRCHKEFIELSRLMPAEQQMSELHDYNYLEPPSPVLDSAAWQKTFLVLDKNH